jgi:hypothetical protein
MPELILLATVCLSAMGLLVFLFLRLNQTQLTLIQSLTQTNQSLLNQVRSTDVSTLSGLQYATGQVNADNDVYISTDDREMAAYREAVAQQHVELGEEVFDDEDLETFRSAL